MWEHLQDSSWHRGRCVWMLLHVTHHPKKQYRCLAEAHRAVFMSASALCTGTTITCWLHYNCLYPSVSLWSKCLHKQFRILPSSALTLLQTTKEIRCRLHQSIPEWNFYVLYIFIYTQVCLGTRSNVWKYNEKNVDRNMCSVTILDDIVMCYINIYLCCENLKRQQKVDWLPQWQILMHIMGWMWRHMDEDAHALLEVNLPALEMF